MGCISMCGPKGYGFSAVLVRNRVSTLAILVSNKVWLELLLAVRPLAVRSSAKANTFNIGLNQETN